MSLEIIDGHELSALAKGHGAMEAALEQIVDSKRTRTLSECRKTARMVLTLAKSWMKEAEQVRQAAAKH